MECGCLSSAGFNFSLNPPLLELALLGAQIREYVVDLLYIWLVLKNLVTSGLFIPVFFNLVVPINSYYIWLL